MAAEVRVRRCCPGPSGLDDHLGDLAVLHLMSRLSRDNIARWTGSRPGRLLARGISGSGIGPDLAGTPRDPAL